MGLFSIGHYLMTWDVPWHWMRILHLSYTSRWWHVALGGFLHLLKLLMSPHVWHYDGLFSFIVILEAIWGVSLTRYHVLMSFYFNLWKNSTWLTHIKRGSAQIIFHHHSSSHLWGYLLKNFLYFYFFSWSLLCAFLEWYWMDVSLVGREVYVN